MVRIAGRGIQKSAAPAVAQLPMTLNSMGFDPYAGVDNAIRAGNRVSEAQITGAERPENLWFKTMNASNYWFQYAAADWYDSNVPIVSTTRVRTCMELFRYGLSLEPKFAFKCEECGHETQALLTRCPVCRSTKLRRPDESQKKYFTRPGHDGKPVDILYEANKNGQALVDVLWSYASDEFLYNQAYLLCVTGEVVDGNGDLIKQVPLEYLAQNPKYVKGLYDETGTFGTQYAFRYDRRNTLVDLSKDEEDVRDTDEDGIRLIPAAWKIGANYGGEGAYMLYSIDEVYQDHWYGSSLTYGRPNIFGIEDELMIYFYTNKHNLKKYQFGYVRKIIVLPGFNEDEAQDIAQGVVDVLSKNTNTIPIVCTPPQAPGVNVMEPHALDLGVEGAGDILDVKREVMNRWCARMGVPNLFAGDVEASGGMNNESQQITIFDRYLSGLYKKVDRMCQWVMSKYPKITDWELKLGRPAKSMVETKKIFDQIQLAQGMQTLGIPYGFNDNEFRFGEKPLDQTMQIAQLQQQGLMDPGGKMFDMSHGMMVGGQMPGDGEGPPEIGTARRADPEIDEAKNEEEQTQHEADDASEI